MRFRVEIPQAGGLSKFIMVSSSDWMSALRTALTGEAGHAAEGPWVCEIQSEKQIRALHASSHKAYQLEVIEDGAQAHELSPVPPLKARKPSQVIERLQLPSTQLVSLNVPPQEDKEPDLLHTILNELEWLYQAPRRLDEVAQRALDLALEMVPSEAGSVLFVGLRRHSLFFAAAHGPRVDQLMGLDIPLDRGIVGFCVREGVALAIDEAYKDRRHNLSLSQEIDYQPDTLLCAPIQIEGRVYGAIELINKRPEAAGQANAPTSEHLRYSLKEVNLVAHLATQVAHYVDSQR